MLRNYKNILLIAGFAGLSACGKYLDRPAPDQAVGKGQLTDADIPLLLKGAYYSMPGTWPPQSYPMTDIYSDDVISIQGGNPTQFNPQAYESCNPSPTDGFGIGRGYSAAYAAIGNSNFIIALIGNRTTPPLQQPLGEALTIRANAYLTLADVHGGVVLTTTLETDINQIRKPKSTEQEVMDAAEKDLQTAIPLLQNFSNAKTVSKQAAQLLLARLYLQRGKYPQAKELAEAVIGSGTRSLSTAGFSGIFRYNSAEKEMIWTMAEGPLQNAYDRYGLYTFYSPGAPFRGTGTGLTWLDETLVNSYEAADVRRKIIRKQRNNATGQEVNYLLKYSGDTLQPSSAAYAVYPLLRVSEAYLIAAEAAARQGSVDVTHYNTLRAARNASTKTAGDFAGAAAFLVEIENERRREFVGEGRRWQDMKRFGKALPFLVSKGQNKTRLYFPFTTTELLRNNKLVQNEGY
ncbi:RagB/SusD family nutrient uptake outer membrane protein [Chitinophaga lutea]|uniref:RagB/SusD family nutrient uptake outer membrane protein n=1 Tax=Chitinophaga lutea TaxID=2488634 RepID=A0A3N4PM64_9BACT|nr:RagB/SusD family nutrient uptake outer membrane protein [Chitinophaga lutea]RPE05417.1 RagB/SusD family nutrient uptake outer membrane protein [Chitinophaga lutea]